jgi:hypothetical protein
MYSEASLCLVVHCTLSNPAPRVLVMEQGALEQGLLDCVLQGKFQTRFV